MGEIRELDLKDAIVQMRNGLGLIEKYSEKNKIIAHANKEAKDSIANHLINKRYAMIGDRKNKPIIKTVDWLSKN